jgi:two-component system, chemotaxis family, protein-glutamate methylesterase/glutaminase
MTGHDIIVIGTSAGGVEALSQLVKALPRDLPAAVFIVLHVPPYSKSILATILDRVGPLPATTAKDHETIQPGRIYVARPDCHLLVKRGHVRLTRGPKENTTRPAIDPLFRTAARYYGRRVIGVVLTGTLDDGTAGLLAVKSRGGIAIVQDPADAFYSGMPQSALDNVAVDYCLPLAEIPAALVRLASEPVIEGEIDVSDDMEQEIDVAEMELDELKKEHRPGKPSRYTCPECNGVLFELDEENLLRFRCRVGHAYSAETLLSEQSNGLEAALWAAMRSLEENISLTRRVAERMRRRGSEVSASQFEGRADDLEKRVSVIRKVLIDQEPIVREQPGEPESTALS